MQPAMEDMLGDLLMEVITGVPMEVLMHMADMQVVGMSNRTGQDTMKSSHME